MGKTILTDIGNCISDRATCNTPIERVCSGNNWVIGMCCGGVGIMVNPVDRGTSGFCGCTEMSDTSSGCPQNAGSDLIRGRMITILPCMMRSYCNKNWGGYGGQCNPTIKHKLSLTYTGKMN